MEIKSKLFHKLPVKFHEDDTYAYESVAWKDCLRFDEGEKRVKVAPVKFANRIKTDMLSYSAMGVLECDKETRIDRLFSEVQMNANKVYSGLRDKARTDQDT